jgi:Flp pilus assembly protein TadD
MGLVLIRLGKIPDAIAEFQAALKINPNDYSAHNNLGLVYAARGEIERARLEFLAAGSTASAAYNVGIVHLAGGDYTRAADAFEAAIEAHPEFTAAKERAHAARVRALGTSKSTGSTQAHEH